MKKVFLTALCSMMVAVLAGCGGHGHPTQITTADLAEVPVLEPQQAMCTKRSVQDVHRGTFPEHPSKKIVIKAKANVYCPVNLGNRLMVTSWITVYKKDNRGRWQAVGSSTPKPPRPTRGYEEFLQHNVPCVNGIYRSQVTFRYVGGTTWNASPVAARSAESVINNCP